MPFDTMNGAAGYTPVGETRLCAVQPLDATRLRTPKLQCRSEQPALGRPDLDCEPQQARGIPRNLQLDETVVGWCAAAAGWCGAAVRGEGR